MSLSVTQERARCYHDQRRLGSLRNSYPDDVIPTERDFVDLRRSAQELPRAVRTPIENTPWHRPSSARPQSQQEYKELFQQRSWLICQEKLDKLHRARLDNAAMLPTRMSSASLPFHEQVVHISATGQQHPPFARHQMPVRGTTAQKLSVDGGARIRAWTGENPDVCGLKKDSGSSLGKSAGQFRSTAKKLQRLNFRFRTDEYGATDLVTYHPAVLRNYFDEEEHSKVAFDDPRIFCRRRIPARRNSNASRHQNTLPNPKNFVRLNTTPFYRAVRSEPSTPCPSLRTPEPPRFRSASAPSAPSKEGRIFHSTRTSISKLNESLTRSESPKRSKQIFKKPSGVLQSAAFLNTNQQLTNTRTSSSVTALFSKESKGGVAVADTSLGVVGTQFVPCRPKTPFRLRRVAIDFKPAGAKKKSLPAGDVLKICVVPTETTTEKPVPPNGNESSVPNFGTRCSCRRRSVRFSCSENTVHEYDIGEPVSCDVDCFAAEKLPIQTDVASDLLLCKTSP